MSQQLAGRVALVTGAASGMGRAHVELMAARGAHVIVCDLAGDAAETVAAGIRAAGGKADALAADVARPSEFAAVAADAERHAGRIDILVNNAGISGMQMRFESIDEATFDRMIAVHVKGSFFATQAVVPGMKARRYGKIINISSNFAMKGSVTASHYTAAKSALLGLTKAWALEFAPWNICVNAVAPGLVKTPLTRRSIGADENFERHAAGLPFKRLAEPREVATAVAFLASSDSDFITGQTLSPAGGDPVVGI